jgi:hypothetical protein
MAGTLRRLLLPCTALVALAVLASAASACPFCTMQGQTLTQEVGQASMVLYGSLGKAEQAATGDFNGGTTELIIDAVIKDHEWRAGKKTILLNRYVPNSDPKYKFLVFCDIYKGNVDPYRGMPIKADSDVVKYLDGALKVKDKDIATRLRFFFDYLDNADVEISNDAYKEFGNADYKDYRDMAKDLPADKIAGWLKDPKTPAFRYGLYASMLGHCGTAEHADLLRSMLDDAQKRGLSGMDGILAGYTLAKPKEGWAYIKGLLGDSSKEFTIRYAALRAARFFWDSRPDIIEHKDVAAAVCQLLPQNDIADLAIEDLRKWKYWDAAGQVLDLRNKESHNIPIIRRAILRYALSCPNNQVAEAYVTELRKKDARLVKDAEELLKLENGFQK